MSKETETVKQISKSKSKKKKNSKSTQKLIPVNGIEFKPYQIQCLEAFAKMGGDSTIAEWLNQEILKWVYSMLSGHPEDFAKEMLEKFDKDGYGR